MQQQETRTDDRTNSQALRLPRLTTMAKAISIAIIDGSKDETVTAEYYVLEDGWFIFKNASHKIVAAYRESLINRLLVQGA